MGGQNVPTDEAAENQSGDQYGGDGGGASVPTSPLPFGWVPSLRRDGASNERDTPPASEATIAREAERDENWLDEGLATLLVVTGIVLFVVPEPASSALGVALVATGLVVLLLNRVEPGG